MFNNTTCHQQSRSRVAPTPPATTALVTDVPCCPCRSHTALPIRSPTSSVPSDYDLTYKSQALTLASRAVADIHSITQTSRCSLITSSNTRSRANIRHGYKSVATIPPCRSHQAVSTRKTTGDLIEYTWEHTRWSNITEFKSARIWHRSIRNTNIWLG